MTAPRLAAHNLSVRPISDERLTAFVLAGLATALYFTLPLLGMVSRREPESPVKSLATVTVEGQPLAANIERLAAALELLGAPLPADLRASLVKAGQARDSQALQQLLDGRVLLSVHINPESRVRVERGPAPAVLQQAGYTPAIVKVVNESGGTPRLRIGSPQAGPVYAGMARLSADRMQQQQLRENENVERRTDRFLDLELFTAAPMTPNLSGLELEYVIALIYSNESGRREATITFDVGQGTQDLGFRAEAPVLFTVKPAVTVRLSVLDHDGHPTTGRFQFEDRQGHVFPPQAKRLAPDLFFQKQINLKEQIYPGANGSKDWPTWTLPVLRWTRAQGGIGGYAHSGSGLQIDPEAATGRLLEQLDSDRNGRLDPGEAARGLLPEPFAAIDTDRDGTIGATELKASHDRADDQLPKPNLAVPLRDRPSSRLTRLAAPPPDRRARRGEPEGSSPSPSSAGAAWPPRPA
jgi:hypothetical protein